MSALVYNSKSTPKGERLNWTPINKVRKVTLKMLDIKGKSVSHNYLSGKAVVCREEHSKFLIP